MTTLKEFLNSEPPFRAWIRWRCVDVYLRKTQQRYFPTQIGPKYREEDRGHGTFTELLAILEKEPLVTYVECVHNERLREFLEDRGYTAMYIETGVPSYFKFPEDG